MTATKPRVGRVKYINCEPVYYGIERGVIPAACQIVDGTPAELNRMLRAGQLDISVISAIEYARHPDRYLILPELAIASARQSKDATGQSGTQLDLTG